MSNIELAVQFFLQLAIILLVCRVVGQVASYLGQPQVVGEMIAGVLLGPSFLGWLSPELQSLVFPWDPTQANRDTQSYLFPVSQLGLALYMFIVGMEFRADIIRNHWKSSVAVSLAGMVAPFLLGAGLGFGLYYYTSILPEKTTLFEAVLFLGASMCITAFPMLARIIHFKGLAGTRMGTVALGAGAIDDATAWCLLAVVLASIDKKPSGALVNIFGGVGLLLVALFILKPLLKRFKEQLVRDEQVSETGLVLCLALMSTGAWFTDRVGLHAVFGAFVIGTAIPRGLVSEGLIKNLQPLTVALLLPLFFTFSGLNTRIGLLNSWGLWLLCGVVLLLAILGKGVACWAAARLTGIPNREALGIGFLMNSRGLMELIIINIGLQRGIISGEIFACLVIMAVITTLMASPLFEKFANPRSITEAAGNAV